MESQRGKASRIFSLQMTSSSLWMDRVSIALIRGQKFSLLNISIIRSEKKDYGDGGGEASHHLVLKQPFQRNAERGQPLFSRR